MNTERPLPTLRPIRFLRVFILLIAMVWCSRLLLIATPESPNQLFSYPTTLTNTRYASGLRFATTWSERWGVISPKYQDVPVLFSFSYVVMGALLPNSGPMAYALVGVLSLLIAIAVWRIASNLGGRRVGLLAALIASFSPYLMFEGARCSPELHAAAFAALGIWSIAVPGGKLWQWGAFGLCMAAALLSRDEVEPLLICIVLGVAISLPKLLWSRAWSLKLKLFNVTLGPALAYIVFWAFLEIFKRWAAHAGDSLDPFRFDFKALAVRELSTGPDVNWLWRLFELEPILPFICGVIAAEPLWNRGANTLQKISRLLILILLLGVLVWSKEEIWFRGRLVVFGFALIGLLVSSAPRIILRLIRSSRRQIYMKNQVEDGTARSDQAAIVDRGELSQAGIDAVTVASHIECANQEEKVSSEHAPTILSGYGVLTMIVLLVGLMSCTTLQWHSTEAVFLIWPILAVGLSISVGNVIRPRARYLLWVLLIAGALICFPAIYTVYRAKSNSVRARGFNNLHPQFLQQPHLGSSPNSAVLQNIAQLPHGKIHVFGHPWRFYPAYILDYPEEYYRERQQWVSDQGLGDRFPDQRDLLNSYILYEAMSPGNPFPPAGTPECWTEAEIIDEHGDSIKIQCHEYRGLEVPFPSFSAPGAVERIVRLRLPISENSSQGTVGFEFHVSAFNIPFGTVVTIDLLNDELPPTQQQLDIYARPPQTHNRPSNPGQLVTSAISFASNPVELELRIRVANTFVTEQVRCPPLKVYIRRPFAVATP